MAQTRKPYREVASDELARIAGTVRHGGVVAVARPRPPLPFDPGMASGWARENRPILVLDGIGNPHNLGAILRSAAYFGVAHAILAERPEQALPSASSYRVAEGALEHLLLYRATLPEAIGALRRGGFRAVGTSLGRWPSRLCRSAAAKSRSRWCSATRNTASSRPRSRCATVRRHDSRARRCPGRFRRGRRAVAECRRRRGDPALRPDLAIEAACRAGRASKPATIIASRRICGPPLPKAKISRPSAELKDYRRCLTGRHQDRWCVNRRTEPSR